MKPRVVLGAVRFVARLVKPSAMDNAVLRVQLITRVSGVVQAKTLLPAAAPQSKERLTSFGPVINV